MLYMNKLDNKKSCTFKFKIRNLAKWKFIE